MNERKLVMPIVNPIKNEHIRRLAYMVTSIIPDKYFIQLKFRRLMGYWPNLKNPTTFNEKLQWLKLNDRKPEYTMMVDKLAVREYIKDKIGEQYLIPQLGSWERAEDINFDLLPEQFVLKCNHDSGSVIICRNKKDFDKERACKKLNQRLKESGYDYGREWPCKNVKPCIIAERYMVDESNTGLTDYKFFCFNGEPMYMFVATDRFIKTKFDFFDMDFNHLDIINGYPNAKNVISKPKSFETMKILAKALSEGIPHVRVDFYDIKGIVYFGELTFYHHSGFVPFSPDHWDSDLGSKIQLD